ncbi:MAG: hypothetical protein M3N26_03225 [Pseudomonadota bacterium]|nr:hypothetical protein [Pseudomonadota bacterium]
MKLDDDCRRIDAVLTILGDPAALAVDANAALYAAARSKKPPIKVPQAAFD